MTTRGSKHSLRSTGAPTRLGALLVLFAILHTAWGCAWILPERFAIRGPVGNSLFGWGRDAPPEEVVDRRLVAAEGFSVHLFAEGVRNARMLRFTPEGDLLVSAPRQGRILLLEPDRDGDGRTDAIRTILDDLDRPHGIDLHEGWLYVAEGGAIARVRFDSEAGKTLGSPERIVADLPEGGNHWTRTLRFGPDGWLYVTIGSSCNACIEESPLRAAMLRFRPDGSGREIHASGLRNTVDFAWRPTTNELYATDNGRDLLGDDFPPCELNRIEAGGFYGWPYANGNRIPDPDHGEGHGEEIAGSIPPSYRFDPHTAPLGIAFLTDDRLPDDYRGAAVVALHGSWNRTELVGYSVVSLHWRPDGPIEERALVTGFEKDGDVIGRPVGVAEGPDGAIYVSDDYAGAVWRIVRGTTVGSGIPTAPSSRKTPASKRYDPEAVERGRMLYEEFACARCHEADVAPPGVTARPLRGLARRYDVEALVEFLAAPAPPMPVFPYAGGDREDLARYLLSTFR